MTPSLLLSGRLWKDALQETETFVCLCKYKNKTIHAFSYQAYFSVPVSMVSAEQKERKRRHTLLQIMSHKRVSCVCSSTCVMVDFLAFKFEENCSSSCDHNSRQNKPPKPFVCRSRTNTSVLLVTNLNPESSKLGENW